MNLDCRHLISVALVVYPGTLRGIKLAVEITTGSITDKIRIVCWRAHAHGFGGSPEEVAHLMGQVLNIVGRVRDVKCPPTIRSEDLIMDHIVVGWLRGTFQGSVRLEEEVTSCGVQ